MAIFQVYLNGASEFQEKRRRALRKFMSVGKSSGVFTYSLSKDIFLLNRSNFALYISRIISANVIPYRVNTKYKNKL